MEENKNSFASSLPSSPLTFLHFSMKIKKKHCPFTSDKLYLVVDRCKHEENEEMEENKNSFASSFTSSPLTFLHVSIKNQPKALFTLFVAIQALFSTSDNLYLIVDR